jgi:hypothetical protein
MSCLLEIANLTPFPMTWAQLDRSGDTRGNLLETPLESRRGVLLRDLAAGPFALVCGFATDGDPAVRRAQVRGPEAGLRPGDALTAWVQYEAGVGFTVGYRDARVFAEGVSGARRDEGAYSWTPRSGSVAGK